MAKLHVADQGPEAEVDAWPNRVAWDKWRKHDGEPISRIEFGAFLQRHDLEEVSLASVIINRLERGLCLCTQWQDFDHLESEHERYEENADLLLDRPMFYRPMFSWATRAQREGFADAERKLDELIASRRT